MIPLQDKIILKLESFHICPICGTIISHASHRSILSRESEIHRLYNSTPNRRRNMQTCHVVRNELTSTSTSGSRPTYKMNLFNTKNIDVKSEKKSVSRSYSLAVAIVCIIHLLLSCMSTSPAVAYYSVAPWSKVPRQYGCVSAFVYRKFAQIWQTYVCLGSRTRPMHALCVVLRHIESRRHDRRVCRDYRLRLSAAPVAAARAVSENASAFFSGSFALWVQDGNLERSPIS